MAANRFHWADYVVTLAMLLVSLGIGFFFACFKGGQKTKVEYLLGNRQMSLGPVCLSLFVTFQSAISLIGTPADTFNTGPMIFYVNLGISLAYLVGYFTVVPVMYPLHLTSVFEYLQLRFKSRAVRLLATVIGMFQTILYMGVALLSPALALQAAAGIPLWVSLVIVGGIGTLYTAVGGIKSVVWTDAFQTIVVFIGMGTVLIKGLKTVGGFSNMIDIAHSGGRMNWAELNPDPRERHSMWGCVFGGCIMWLVNCFNQSSVQRIGSLKTLKSARLAFLLNTPLNILYGITLTLTGLLLYAYVVTIGCDPFQAGLIHNKNQMMPYFVIHVLDDLPGFAGLYMSMLFSGALSTVSSGINALAANSVEDLLATPLQGLRDTTVTIIAKLLVVLYGMATIGLAYAMKALSGPVTQLATTAFGACGGPVVGMFMLGGGVPRANKYSAILGGLVGLVANLWLSIGCRLYGKPIVSLPPGPTDNCILTNATTIATSITTASVLGLNASSSSTLLYSSSYQGLLGLNTTSEGYYSSYYYQSGGLGGHGSSSSGFGGGGPSTFPNYYDAETVTGLNGTLDAAAVVAEPFSVYDVSYMWLGVFGLFTTLISGIIVTFITGSTDPDTLDSRLIFPFCRKIYGLPEPVQRPDDISNVIAMKHYREAWDTFKNSSINSELVIEAGELNDNGLLEHSPSEHLTFAPTKRLAAD